MKRAALVLAPLFRSALLIFFTSAAFSDKGTGATSENGGSVPANTRFERVNSAEYFIKTSYSLDPDATLFPWALTISDHGVWAIGELAFRSLQGLVPEESGIYPPTTTAYRIPITITDPVSENGPFLTLWGGKSVQSDYSILGEEIVTDGSGRIWFAQGGHLLTPLDRTNYSRVISFQPPGPGYANGEFCVYNIPDDNAQVLGVAWDAQRNLVWFAQSSMYAGIGALVSFNPAEMTKCANDYVWQLDTQGNPVNAFVYDYCKLPGQRECFTKYPLPADYPLKFSKLPEVEEQDIKTTGWASFLRVIQPPHPDAGSVWFTLSAGDAIGRLNPDARGGQQLTVFPIGDDPYSKDNFLIHNNAGAWDIDVHPGTGDIVFTAYNAQFLGKFDISQYLSGSYKGECESIGEDGLINPCMQLMPVPGLSSVHHVHQMDFDKYGNAWFSVTTEGCLNSSQPNPHEPASIGFVDSLWTEVIYFDHLDFDSDMAISAKIDESGRLECDGTNDWFHTGIATDFVDDRLNIWFTDSFQRKIRRLEVKQQYIGKNLYCEIRKCN